MNWFSGQISEAIAEAQTQRLVFLVYTFDSNSKDMDELWLDEDIANLCAETCVAIKLESDSESCNQFKQIYPIACFPTTYLIGNVGGTPIRIISGAVNKTDFIEKLENAFEIHKTQKKALESAQNVPVTTAGTSTQAELGQSGEQSNETPLTSEDPELQKKKLDEKVAQAKEKLRKIQEKKRLEDEENEKVRELERRRLGQEVVKAKSDKEELEMKRLAEQKRKEKLEDELAKRRVMERIKEDREAKQQKYAAEKSELDKTKEAARVQKELAKQQQQMIDAANKGKFARIQFRLTDGSSVVNQFEPEQTLEDARAFIAEKLKEMNESTTFTMHSTFPKRDYTVQDMSSTLRDLQLVPSATLLIIPTRSKTSKAFSNLMPMTSASANDSSQATNSVVSYASDLLGFIFLPFTIIWGIISNLIGIRNNAGNRPIHSSSQNTSAPNMNLRRNAPVRLRHNVRGLADRDDNEDDDRSTYNGNSTQQM